MLFCVKVTAFLNTIGIWCKYAYGQIPHALFNIRKPEWSLAQANISQTFFFYPKRKYFEASNSPEEIESVYWGYF